MDAFAINLVQPAPDNPFEDASPEALVLDLDGFEGPLDVLLTLARGQKVDLRKLSVLELADQYLGFISAARRLRLELAADYLVMAAWLAYLKSRLLLPEPEEDGPTGEEIAAHLAFQLERLQVMRAMAARIMGRDQLLRDFFPRGEQEAATVERETRWSASLVDLLRAYARQRTRDNYQPLHIEHAAVYAVDAALDRLRALVGGMVDWTVLGEYLPSGWRTPEGARSAMASTFAATLELARNGAVRLHQNETFGPIYLRRAEGAAPPPPGLGAQGERHE